MCARVLEEQWGVIGGSGSRSARCSSGEGQSGTKGVTCVSLPWDEWVRAHAYTEQATCSCTLFSLVRVRRVARVSVAHRVTLRLGGLLSHHAAWHQRALLSLV